MSLIKLSCGFRVFDPPLYCLSADNGRGNPVFAGETDCTYYFNWETSFACVKEKEDLLCRLRDGNKHYDLSPLTRSPGERDGFSKDVSGASAPKVTLFIYFFLVQAAAETTGRRWTPLVRSRTLVTT